jgi:hypothetical protein
VLSSLAVVALVVAAVVTVHWGGGTSTAGPDPGRTPSPVPGTSTTSLTEAERLARGIGLRARDLPAGFVPGREDTWTVLDPRAGLDLCGAAYPSDGLRLVARRAAFAAADGRRVATRVIVYEDGHAEQALAELRATAPTCSRPVPPGPEEQPGTLALRVRSTGSLNRSARHELVVERRGDVLVLLDTDRTSGRLTLDLARVLGGRLLSQLPDR